MSKTCACGNNMIKEEWKHQWVCHCCGRTKPISIKQTNAEKYFRDATDEEIAKYIANKMSGCPYVLCKNTDCYKCLLNWLEQEAESDG